MIILWLVVLEDIPLPVMAFMTCIPEKKLPATALSYVSPWASTGMTNALTLAAFSTRPSIWCVMTELLVTIMGELSSGELYSNRGSGTFCCIGSLSGSLMSTDSAPSIASAMAMSILSQSAAFTFLSTSIWANSSQSLAPQPGVLSEGR
ncbi:MAG: hypothetical protein A4E30_01607 [Methanomassiliicoccales archaeon PtaB.Bin215]|nr:MAG: hypothetical protein A4E30_01607 [Methanomassiliicoccales archaeon PtaB.Bin215]